MFTLIRSAAYPKIASRGSGPQAVDEGKEAHCLLLQTCYECDIFRASVLLAT